MKHEQTKVALITGAARRIGATIARTLHAKGMNVIIHYCTAETEAAKLCDELNAQRQNSATILAAELTQSHACEKLINSAHEIWGRLDVLVNNASRFYPTKMNNVTDQQWLDLIDSNLKAPFFLAQAAANFLRTSKGCIVNIADIHGEKPLKDYSVYSISKAGLIMLTKSLAKELAPEIRVNAVAPGAVLWPEEENELAAATKLKIIDSTALKRAGRAEDVAKAVWFFIAEADYVTGQFLGVDGGRLLSV
jgi:pteridine reductase